MNYTAADLGSTAHGILMRTLLTILGVWLLINVLFVVVMIPPRKPRAPDSGPRTGGLVRARIRADEGPYDDPPASLRHVIIAIALGTFFSLTPPLLDAYDAIDRCFRRLRDKPQARAGKNKRR
ncbi:hypothetical protein ACVIWV_001086 [Bradyrhizobium diazoefficiens]